MYLQVLTDLGLTKNEAQIYETLIKGGEMAVGAIAEESKIHRRNVYDAIKRLIEKGLVFEILGSKENHYQAVDPNKLSDILGEKQQALQKVIPVLEKLYKSVPHQDEVFIYKGLEGWKNYMRDILRLKEDVYTLGGSGQLADKKIRVFLEQFEREAKKKNIKFYTLFDHTVKHGKSEMLKNWHSKDYKFLPKEFSTDASVDIFGDHVVIVTVGEDAAIDDSSLTVIVNPKIADAFRTWHKLMWSVSSK
ncbi:MAG: helix-turn-helix domain-containing protein [Patescibacteria group bacterium]|jgi:sugar-specific transcriptional regulator TrmB